MAAKSHVLTSKTDVFGGVTVNSVTSLNKDFNEVIPDSEVVTSWIKSSLEHWKKEKVNGVWFEVDLKHASWIPILATHGFQYHHARGAECVMTKWLNEQRQSSLPLYPFTTIGLGGVVVNKKGEVLLMKEKKSSYLGWKFPGGMADPGETLKEAVKREVFEETGVKAEFISVIAFRHMNKGFYPDTGDIYFLCYMTPTDESNIDIVPCEHETAAAQWMSREEISKLPDKEFHRFHQLIMERLEKHLASGKKGCYQELFDVNIGSYKRQWDMYLFDE